MGSQFTAGGTGPDTFDASGFIQYCFQEAGISLPKGASNQANAPGGTVVDCSAAEPGDLVFYEDSYTGYINFVGAFKNSTAVYQCTEPKGCYIEPDIFNHAYFGTRIKICKRYWSDSIPFPTQTVAATGVQSSILEQNVATTQPVTNQGIGSEEKPDKNEAIGTDLGSNTGIAKASNTGYIAGMGLLFAVAFAFFVLEMRAICFPTPEAPSTELSSDDETGTT
jgi:hypothetical protein